MRRSLWETGAGVLFLGRRAAISDLLSATGDQEEKRVGCDVKLSARRQRDDFFASVAMEGVRGNEFCKCGKCRGYRWFGMR